MLFSAGFKHSRNSLIDLDADIIVIMYAIFKQILTCAWQLPL